MDLIKNKDSNRAPQSSRIKCNNNIFQNSKTFLPNMKNDNTYFLRRDLTVPNLKSLNFSFNDKNNISKSLLNESIDKKFESLNEEYVVIQKIWEDLGITHKYRIQFDNYIKTVSKTKIKNIFINEKSNLKRYGETLLKLSKEISSRENNIHSLRKYCYSLINSSDYFEDEKDKRNQKSTILNIINIIKSLRLNSVKIINLFLEVREITTYYNLIGKIDMKLINKDYNYDEKYLIKMRKDMNFLNEIPQLSKYFYMNDTEIDPFLTNFAPKNITNKNYSKFNSSKVKIPVSENMKKDITQCRYALLQESFFDKMKDDLNITKQKLNNNDYQNINTFIYSKNNISRNLNDSGRLKNVPRNSFFKDEDENKKEYQNYYNNNFYNLGNKEEKIIKNIDVKFLRKDEDIKKIIKKKIINFNTNEYSFRKSFFGNNQLMIEREEKNEKKRSKFKLKNNFIYKIENPLIEENEELNKQLDEVCTENESLKEEINKLKKYMISSKKKLDEEEKEREKINIRKSKEITKKELES